MPILDRLKKAWNVFKVNEEPTAHLSYGGSQSYSFRPDRQRLRHVSERSIIASIYTQISIDVASLPIRHVQLDELNRYSKDVESALNTALQIEPNLDQGPRAFRQDIVATLLDKGCAAIVPVDTSVDPQTNEVFDVFTLRVGEIVSWQPKHIRVSLYNENKGTREEVTLEKRFVAIVENPLYSVMNQPNSTLQRLTRKLMLLDTVDEESSSGKLDMIIQLPYVIKSEARKQQAEQRRQDIELQLKGSKYGIAYTDGTEKITQLNRPVENNLLSQIEMLKDQLYSELGITPDIMNGKASEQATLNYQNRTIFPIIESVIEAMQRAFIGPTRLRRNERIAYFRDPFKLVPIAQIAEIADKFTRNEILTSNEIRGFMGIPPSTDPKADALQNSNMPQPNQPAGIDVSEMDKIMNEVFDGLASDIDKLAGGSSNDETE